MTVSFTQSKMASGLIRQLANAKKVHQDAIEKLSSGTNFSSQDPRPADRAIADRMDFRLRSLAVAKRNANDAVSMFQTAEDALSEVNNIIVRMKEIGTTAASTTMSGRERRYLFVEYEALYEEVNRIALSTEFNGIPLLNGDSSAMPESLTFKIGDVVAGDDGSYSEEDDVNTIRLDGLRDVVATPGGLGIMSAAEILQNSDELQGVDIEDVYEIMEAQDPEFPTAFDAALNVISSQRAVYGALQSRLQRSMDYIDVYQENISAAKSNISDSDYASEMVKLTKSAILSQATTGLMSQINFEGNLTLNLLSSAIR